MEKPTSQPAQRMTAATAQPGSVDATASPVVVPARLIQGGEEVVLALKPSLLFVLLVSVPFITALAMVAASGYAVDSLGIVNVRLQLLVVLCLILGLVRVFIGFLQWISRLYVLTNRRVIRVKGVLRVDIFECPLARVQNTVVSLSLGERIFALGSILFATAGTGVMEAKWAMLSRPMEVHEIVVEYIRRAQGPSGGKDI